MMMNEDKSAACLQLFKDNFVKYIIFYETPEGEIGYYGEHGNEHWEYLFNKKVFGFGRRYFHFFKFQNDTLEWVETYDFDTRKSHLAVDLDDDMFLLIAQEAHKNDITINEQVTLIMKEMLTKYEKETK
jgi:hypothetical protein